MKVFISWSGNPSRAIAGALAEWLPLVLQAVHPYYSPEEITTGERWQAHIAGALEEARTGIVCVTASNQSSPWLNFEAGALSKFIKDGAVCPILFGLRETELAYPLAQFQGAEFGEEAMHRLVRSINSKLGDRTLPEAKLDATFGMWWPQLERGVAEALATVGSVETPRRSAQDLLEELLTLTRAVHSTLTAPATTNEFLRSLRASATLEDAILEHMRVHPATRWQEAFSADLKRAQGDSWSPGTLKAVVGDFRLSGGETTITKRTERNPLLPEEKGE